jgi:hypothetical protein
MFACFDAVIYEVLGYKTPRLKAKHQARSEARQRIREQRQQAKATQQGKTSQQANPVSTKQLEAEAKHRTEAITEQRQRDTRTTEHLSSQHQHRL